MHKPNYEDWGYKEQGIYLLLLQSGREKEAEKYRDRILYDDGGKKVCKRK